MSFYDLNKNDRELLVKRIREEILQGLKTGETSSFVQYYSDEDTYIRKTAYLACGRIYEQDPDLRKVILNVLLELSDSDNHLIRQTVINSAGEIAKKDFEVVTPLFEKGITDIHHQVKNAVIGSLKKSGQGNPEPILQFARKHLHHPDKEIRRQIVHGIELRGRTHPEEVLPLLKELQWEPVSRVRNMVIHVLGQIAYKKGCLETVLNHLQTWKNRNLVQKALEEILDVHKRYMDFSYYSPEKAKEILSQHLRR